MPLTASEAATARSARPGRGPWVLFGAVAALGCVIAAMGLAAFVVTRPAPRADAGATAEPAIPAAVLACASGDPTACRAPCDAGHGASCRELGTRYETGRGLPKDEAAAAEYHRRACDAGDPVGCMHLGAQYADGRGVARDDDRAAQLLRRACEGGETLACRAAPPPATPSALPTPPAAPASAPAASDALPREVIQRIIQQHRGQYRACYERALGRNPSLTGRVKVRFAIARDGSVESVSDAGSNLPDREVVACVLRAFGTLAFPSYTGEPITVVYPLMFAPG
jgi:hypothetical protein